MGTSWRSNSLSGCSSVSLAALHISQGLEKPAFLYLFVSCLPSHLFDGLSFYWNHSSLKSYWDRSCLGLYMDSLNLNLGFHWDWSSLYLNLGFHWDQDSWYLSLGFHWNWDSCNLSLEPWVCGKVGGQGEAEDFTPKFIPLGPKSGIFSRAKKGNTYATSTHFPFFFFFFLQNRSNCKTERPSNWPPFTVLQWVPQPCSIT